MSDSVHLCSELITAGCCYPKKCTHPHGHIRVVNLASHRVFFTNSFKPEVLWFVLENTLGKTVSEGILGQEMNHDDRGRLRK